MNYHAQHYALNHQSVEYFSEYPDAESLLKDMRKYLKSLGDRTTMLSLEAHDNDGAWFGTVITETL